MSFGDFWEVKIPTKICSIVYGARVLNYAMKSMPTLKRFSKIDS